MSSAVTGQNGKVIIAGTGEVVEIRNWSISRKQATPEVTSMSSGGNQVFKHGLKGWDGSFETVKFTDLSGVAGVGSFYVGSAATGSTPIFSGTVLISDAPVECPVDGVVAYRHTFQGSGPCGAATT